MPCRQKLYWEWRWSEVLIIVQMRTASVKSGLEGTVRVSGCRFIRNISDVHCKRRVSQEFNHSKKLRSTPDTSGYCGVAYKLKLCTRIHCATKASCLLFEEALSVYGQEKLVSLLAGLIFCYWSAKTAINTMAGAIQVVKGTSTCAFKTNKLTYSTRL